MQARTQRPCSASSARYRMARTHRMAEVLVVKVVMPMVKVSVLVINGGVRMAEVSALICLPAPDRPTHQQLDG